MPTAFHKVLEDIRKTARTEREKGEAFEQIVKDYLQHEPCYKDLFGGKVYLWDEWRKKQMRANPVAEQTALGYNDPGADAGIDLVAEQNVAENPEIYAIQAKFYKEGSNIRKRDMDSFLSHMGTKPFTRGLLFVTSTTASQNAQNTLKSRDKPVNVLDLTDLQHSHIDWSKYRPGAKPTLRQKKEPKDHQAKAIRNVVTKLSKADRGKLLMACGTGKTFTSLKIAEQMAGRDGRVLFLVPSLALLSQTLTEWTQQSRVPLHSFAVCSDTEVGDKKQKQDDDPLMLMHELRYPATTKPRMLAQEMAKRHDKQHMSVVFSTYQSIDVISKAQKQHKLPSFDLIVCDEAHRTTGATWQGDKESHFVKVHDASFIKANKRLYMTATQKIYGNQAKAREEQGGVILCSMDDPKLYGDVLHALSFSEAVDINELCDYKVIVLSVDAKHISHRLQHLLKDADNSLKVDDAARIVGCWKALSKADFKEDTRDDPEPMRRAVGFCQRIEPYGKSKTHKVSSRQIAGMFEEVVRCYQQAARKEGADHGSLTCQAEHIDGTMNAGEKEEQINWLKDDPPDNTCRILSNVRCLSEGVDVPALDAVLFLAPRNSPVEVVQSVGRVMRNAPGKKRGYVILPVVIPENMEPQEALDDNQTYRVVWEVLQALRSHDDRFNGDINKMELNGGLPDKLEFHIVTDDTKPKSKAAKGTARGQHTIGTRQESPQQPDKQTTFSFEPGELERALYAKIVKKCGDRLYWDEWASDIARIAQTHITRISAIVNDQRNKKEVKAFNNFTEELRDDLNDSVTDDEVIEMLAQHLITKPVFDALFEDYSFAAHNPVSQAMQKVLDVLQEHHLEKEADTLNQFYQSVRMRAEGINTAEGKQKIMVELYDKFFRNAFPRMTERLGIVYTPTEVVDFIIRSTNDLLQQEFNQTLGSKGVHIIDPFTGTGTFITRLLQSKLINKDQLQHKYNKEIHANEIVLLAYYIATINIEATYHAITTQDTNNKYQPFQGICLTDTFQMYEKDDLISELMVDNSDRRKRQKKLDIRVVMGNPPYSAGQTSANDNNANISYESLDTSIRKTYAARSTATNRNALYDSYIRAIRWASDRLCKNKNNPRIDLSNSECAKQCQCAGIIGYVTNAGWLETNTADGMRKCLAEEFSSIHVFHLRGNQRTQGEISRREGGKIFGSGSRAPIAISLLVKNPNAKKHGQIFIHDIGDYLTREQKLDKIKEYASIQGITSAKGWQPIKPDKHGDWLNQRDDTFHDHIVLGDRGGDGLRLFTNYSNGVKTQRDAWCYNSSGKAVASNMRRMIDFYNSELERFEKKFGRLDVQARSSHVDGFINTDPMQISWSAALKQDTANNNKLNHDKQCLTKSLYRPFSKQYMYYSRRLNERVYQMPKVFPDGDKIKNLVIMTTAKGAKNGFSCAISNIITDLNSMEAGAQCFPLYLYESANNNQGNTNRDLFASKAKKSGYTRRDGITDEGLQHFQQAYPKEKISKQDIFYYIYGLLHSPEYRERYADNLSKELPRIPCVKTAKGFWAFSQAGRDLAHWHLNYETVERYQANIDRTVSSTNPREVKKHYRVTKMKHPKTKNAEGKSANDLTTIIYNDYITISNIPEEAYDYVVNGKSAIAWVMERQCVKTDKASGIVNDANDWATQTVNNPKYPLDLLLRIITVSLETNNIVNSLPPLDI